MNWIRKINNLRREYSKSKIDEKSIKPDPFEQFKIWFDEAVDSKLLDANAMTLTTSTTNGKPSSRIVLLKRYGAEGFVFFTNYDSRKGVEIAENPQVSALFYWAELERQIRIEGKARKIPPESSYDYFKTRPRESRLGAWASKQSKPLTSRFKLVRSVMKYFVKFPFDVPLPPYWGGFAIIPSRFEFWQGRKSRLHDRFVYEPKNGRWEITRLYP